MAIGDAVAVILGTATVNRQPASGVEEQISSIVKGSTADAINFYDGSVTKAIIVAGDITNANSAASNQRNGGDYNTAHMITNSVYLRKTGTTDTVYVAGVQTNV